MEKQLVMASEEMQRTISRMAHEILEKCGGVQDLALLGIRSRGAFLVRRIAQKVAALTGTAPSVGIIDVTAFRDDIASRETNAQSDRDKVAVSVDEKTVILVDDVIYTGRTIRAALNMVSRLGNPRRVLVAILVDRGRRQLPIKADIVGKNVDVADSERVNVLLQESDGVDRVVVAEKQTRSRLRTEA